jgi:hypothetical protein
LLQAEHVTEGKYQQWIITWPSDDSLNTMAPLKILLPPIKRIKLIINISVNAVFILPNL